MNSSNHAFIPVSVEAQLAVRNSLPSHDLRQNAPAPAATVYSCQDIRSQPLTEMAHHPSAAHDPSIDNHGTNHDGMPAYTHPTTGISFTRAELDQLAKGKETITADGSKVRVFFKPNFVEEGIWDRLDPSKSKAKQEEGVSSADHAVKPSTPTILQMPDEIEGGVSRVFSTEDSGERTGDPTVTTLPLDGLKQSVLSLATRAQSPMIQTTL